jgi:uncharacterized protein (UPF0261 family)
MGGEPKIVELSVGKEVGWADISVSEVLDKISRTVDEVIALERAKASEVIVEGAISLISEMFRRSEVDGMIAFGGSLGTSMATRIMQTLPIGVPKLMVSTMTSGDVGCYVGTRDIGMLYPIGEVGLNVVTRKVLNNAAAGIVGMASALPLPVTEQRPLIGCTMLGVTTPGVLRASKYFEGKDYDVMIHHAVGSGGRSMEELISDGLIVGTLDITTHEITDFLLGGVLNAGPERLTAAGRKGIPQVISTGALELIDFGPRNTVPKKLEEEEARGAMGRKIHIHNPGVTVVGITPDEAYTIGQHIAEKINCAQGPTVLCVPLRGSGAYEIARPNLDLGWAGPGPGPLWMGDPDKPEWSLRTKHFIAGLRSKIDLEKPNLDMLIVDRHINEPQFADLMAKLLEEMLLGLWEKGSHRDLPEFVSFQ